MPLLILAALAALSAIFWPEVPALGAVVLVALVVCVVGAVKEPQNRLAFLLAGILLSVVSAAMTVPVL